MLLLFYHVIAFLSLFRVTYLLIKFATIKESAFLVKGAVVITEEDEPKDGGDQLKLRNGGKYETLLIFLKVGKNLMRNPNTYATFMGLIWASIHFR